MREYDKDGYRIAEDDNGNTISKTILGDIEPTNNIQQETIPSLVDKINYIYYKLQGVIE